MIVRDLRIVAALVALLAVGVPENLVAQQPPGAESGIWIAGPDGNLRSVAPVRAAMRSGSPAAPRAAPVVWLVLAVENHARSAAGAVAGSELAVARVSSALVAAGVSPMDITTEPGYVHALHERRLLAAAWEPRRISGYEAAHLVTVRVGNPARVGMLIDHAIGAGASRVVSMDTEPTGR